LDRLFNKLIKTGRVERVILSNVIFKKVKKYQLSECNFEKKRILLMNYKDLLKSLQYNKDSQQSITNILEEVLETYSIIVWICYTRKSAQKKKGIQLLLHFSCFNLSLLCKKLPKELKLMNLFLHEYFSHFPIQFESVSFELTNTEEGERNLHHVKSIFRDSSKNVEQTLKLFFEKISKMEERELLGYKTDEERVKVITTNKTDPKEDVFSPYRLKMASFQNPKLKLPSFPGQGSDEERSTHLFVKNMKEKYPNLLSEQDGHVTFFVKEDINKYLDETAPKQKKNKKK